MCSISTKEVEKNGMCERAPKIELGCGNMYLPGSSASKWALLNSMNWRQVLEG